MVSLDALLKQAAEVPDWEHAVVHRCAWCKRIATRHGDYKEAGPVDTTIVVTDGMCAACAAKALAHLGRRRAVRLTSEPNEVCGSVESGSDRFDVSPW